MKKPPIKETLEQTAIRTETERHAHRLKSIKRMAASLKALQPYADFLKESGIEIHASDITQNHKGELHILSGFFRRKEAVKAIALLEGWGFTQMRFEPHVSYTQYMLQKGRLKVLIDEDKPISTDRDNG